MHERDMRKATATFFSYARTPMSETPRDRAHARFTLRAVREYGPSAGHRPPYFDAGAHTWSPRTHAHARLLIYHILTYIILYIHTHRGVVRVDGGAVGGGARGGHALDALQRHLDIYMSICICN